MSQEPRRHEPMHDNEWRAQLAFSPDNVWHSIVSVLRNDVAMVRSFANAIGAETGLFTRAEMLDLADRIEALLPPKRLGK